MKIIGYICILLWALLSFKYCADYKNCPSAAAVAAGADNECPICYRWGSPEAIICDNFESYKESILNDIADDQSLQITSYYNPAESADHEIGRNRGVSAKALFNKVISEERIRINVKLDDKIKSERCIKRVDFQLVSTDGSGQSTANDATILYVSSRSDFNDKDVSQSITEVLDQAEGNKKYIRIIAHAFDKTSKIDNIKLGQERADMTRAYFISKGIKNDRIITVSKGNQEPVSDSENNRIEIRITNS